MMRLPNSRITLVSVINERKLHFQVSQAMSYLHSRGIVHGHLNSRNVFLEAKVKLSILDHSMVEECGTEGSARIPRHLLNYLPPEVGKISNKLPDKRNRYLLNYQRDEDGIYSVTRHYKSCIFSNTCHKR